MSANVLVIDDAPEVRRLVQGILEAEGYRVKVAGTAQEGMNVLKNDAVALLLLDLNLPDRPGTDVCRELRSAGYHLPILMLTTRNSVADRTRGLQLGADDYIGKPFAPEELAARVAAHLRRQEFQEQKAQDLLAQRWEAIHKGLALAHSIQQPLRALALTGLEAAVHHVPIGRVGGDLYLIEEKGEEVYILVGDTMGKGVQASLVMSWTLATLHQLVERKLSPARIVNEAHRVLAAEMQELGVFVTLFCGLYHRPTRNLKCVTAGCEPALILNRSSTGRRHTVLSSGSLPLGVAEAAAYQEFSLQVPPGSRLFVYTDGLLDSVEAKLQASLFRQVYRILIRFMDRPVETLPGALMQQIKMLTPGGVTLRDDLTFVLMELS